MQPPSSTSRRPSAAMIVALMALFVALGGSGYAALSGIPDRSGSFHGCVDKATGALRVVTSSGSCRRAKTVRRGKKRIRYLGELAMVWNQQGRPGANGQAGAAGTAGTSGPAGPTAGATAGPVGDPPAGATNAAKSVQITTTTPGRFLVFGRFDPRSFIECFIAPCAVAGGLYVDGVPVSGTLVTNSSTNTSFHYLTNSVGDQLGYDRFGITSGPLAPGTHTVSIASEVTQGVPDSSGFEGVTNAAVGAILLGS
jgi:hypothetical protein